MPDQKSDDVIDNVITSIDGVIAMENIEKAEDVLNSIGLNVKVMIGMIRQLQADKAILENELESYKQITREMESESGANR